MEERRNWILYLIVKIWVGRWNEQPHPRKTETTKKIDYGPFQTNTGSPIVTTQEKRKMWQYQATIYLPEELLTQVNWQHLKILRPSIVKGNMHTEVRPYYIGIYVYNQQEQKYGKK